MRFALDKSARWYVIVFLFSSAALFFAVSARTAASPPHAFPAPQQAAQKFNGRIAFVASGRISTVNANGSDLTEFGDTNNRSSPAWSPDGSKILFARGVTGGGPDLYVMNADGTGSPTPVMTTAEPESMPAWSPDAARVVFCRNDAAGRFDIFTAGADGGGVVRLTQNAGNNTYPAWSPDGSKIAFTSTRDGGAPNGDREIYVMNADGSNPLRLTANAAQDGRPVWSPDGSRILFISQRDGNPEVYLMGADGGAQTNLSVSQFTDSDPVWSPDGTRVAFISNRDAIRNTFINDLYLMNVDGSDVTRITNLGSEKRELSWQPLSNQPPALPTPTPVPTPTPGPFYNIYGSVKTAAGQPVSGVTIKLVGSDTPVLPEETVTDAEGKFTARYGSNYGVNIIPSKEGLAFDPPNSGRISSRGLTGDITVAFTARPASEPGPSQVRFPDSEFSVREDEGRVLIRIFRFGDLTHEASVYYTTASAVSLPANCAEQSQSASPRCDFVATLGRITFPPGEFMREFSVPVVDDTHAETVERFHVVLSQPVNMTLGQPVSASIQLFDNDTGAPPKSTAVDQTPFFVRQHYLDFLSREPEADGFTAWTDTLDRCSDVQNDPTCDRVHVSRSFFESEEFGVKGFFVYKYYKVSLGRVPTYTEMQYDMALVSARTGDERVRRQDEFATNWVRRAIHVAVNPAALTNRQFVDGLEQRAGISLSGKDALIAALDAGAKTRAQVLREAVESQEVSAKIRNEALVAMQYFGYLRRDPEEKGFGDWLRTIDENPADIRRMIRGFVDSVEYRNRFGKP